MPPTEAAFAHRADQYDLRVLAQWADTGDSDRNIARARAVFDDVRPHLEDAVYVNNLGSEGTDRVRAAYGAGCPRPAAVKQVDDPANVFRMNQNVRPQV